ncbi:MAG: alpha-L-rhamnosidase C-terminal domain-containing protein [Candidatus Brocadiia bacterium]
MPQVHNIDMTGKWRASWCWSDERGGPDLTVRRFRRTFVLDSAPEEFIIHVSADSRYRLFVNGLRAGRGPLKGELEHYHYESYDIAPMLREGENLLAAEVFWFGLDAPNSEIHSGFAGFLLQGPEGAEVDTPGNWKVQVDRAVTADTTSYIANAQNFLNHTERVDGREFPRGWQEPDFDDGNREAAVYVCDADVPRNWGETHPIWELKPRPLPQLTEERRWFRRTIVDMEPAEHLFGEPARGWKLEGGEGGEIVLDAGVLTTGYPELIFQGGAGRTVEIIYGECIGRWDDPLSPGGRRHKAVRDDLDYGDVDGYRDTVILPGGEFRYEPFHWRTFWFVRVKVLPGEEPFELKDFTYRFTAYPQELKARYDSSAPDAGRMMELSWRTLQLCSHETYEDCPYYEQHNYLFDSHNEALCSYALAGETELPKHTIRQFRDSMRPDGLVHGRVPSRRRLRLTYYALAHVQMLRNHWLWVGEKDLEFIRESLFSVEATLWWFREHLRDDDLMDRLPYWSPPQSGLTWLTCEYAYALQSAIELYTEVGRPEDADRWRPWLERVRGAVREQCWDEEVGLFLPHPEGDADHIDQLSQAYAIMAGVANPEQRERILENFLTYDYHRHTGGPRRYFVARVMEEHGLYDRFEDAVLPYYRAQVDNHLTTWVEGHDPGRSDCHAWNSWVAVDFLTAVLGIKPLKPGFEEILIRPQVIYEHAQGRMPTVQGPLSVSWRRAGEQIRLEAEAPKGIPTTVELPGAEPKRFPDGGRVSAKGTIN